MIRAKHSFCCGFVFLFSVVCLAQAAPLPDAQRAAIDAAVSQFMAKTQVPGVSIAIVEHGAVAWSQGYGFADLENNVPATEHTLYRLASVSKPITAVAAMELSQRGKLDLDAPVQRYCPAFPQKPWPVTTREVMGHLGGIRHYHAEVQEDVEGGNTKHFDDPIQGGLDFFKNDPLIAQPGTKFNYSTQGFTLVGCVIEGAAGIKYVDFVRENVFAPADMKQTQADDRFAVIRYRTRFYSKDEVGRVINSDFLDSSYKIPGGGWLSSAEDMAHFEIALLNDKLLSHQQREIMWKPQAAPAEHSSYALGWGVSLQAGNVRRVGHNGGQQGTSTAIMILPEQQAGVVVLTNMDGADASELAETLLKLEAAH